MMACSDTFTWLQHNIISHKYEIINGILLREIIADLFQKEYSFFSL